MIHGGSRRTCHYCGQGNVRYSERGEPHGRHGRGARCKRAHAVAKEVCRRVHGHAYACQLCHELTQRTFVAVEQALGEAHLFLDTTIETAVAARHMEAS